MVRWMHDTLLTTKTIAKPDMKIFTTVDTAQDAIDAINKFYKK
jgi:predicted Rossmann-fold nucleotide-binding protein